MQKCSQKHKREGCTSGGLFVVIHNMTKAVIHSKFIVHPISPVLIFLVIRISATSHLHSLSDQNWFLHFCFFKARSTYVHQAVV
jgi:hypothetical protein